MPSLAFLPALAVVPVLMGQPLASSGMVDLSAVGGPPMQEPLPDFELERYSRPTGKKNFICGRRPRYANFVTMLIVSFVGSRLVIGVLAIMVLMQADRRKHRP